MLKKSLVLKQIRQQCESGKRYLESLKNINIDGVRRRVNPQTLENWRNQKLSIDRYILHCINIRDEKITDAVEDKLKDRILQGEASPAEIIFYLCNRRTHRWKRFEYEQQLIDNSKHLHFIKMDDKKLENEIQKTYENLFSSASGRISTEASVE